VCRSHWGVEVVGRGRVGESEGIEDEEVDGEKRWAGWSPQGSIFLSRTSRMAFARVAMSNGFWRNFTLPRSAA
jgi:hypothetical protein